MNGMKIFAFCAWTYLRFFFNFHGHFWLDLTKENEKIPSFISFCSVVEISGNFFVKKYLDFFLSILYNTYWMFFFQVHKTEDLWELFWRR